MMLWGRQALLELCFCIVLSTDTLKEPEIEQVRHSHLLMSQNRLSVSLQR